VYISRIPNFTKTGGIITGYSSDQINGNVVKDAGGNILSRRGHAIYINRINDSYPGGRKETTSGTGDNLSHSGTTGGTGAWDE